MADICNIVNYTLKKVNDNTKEINKIKSKSNFLIRSVNINQNKILVVTNVLTPEPIKSSNGVILSTNSDISDIRCLENILLIT